jgi:hypothetical protein
MRDKERRAFVRGENLALGRFLNVEHLAAWSRHYHCEACGFRCTSPGDIWDHTLACGASDA